MSFMLIMACTSIYAQALKVSGTVTSADDNLGIIGATVKEQGTQNAVVTDLEGNFTINVKTGAKLEFSYIGMQTVVLAADANMKVTLSSNPATIDEVVVTGYTSEKKADLTGSVSVIKMKDIADVPTGNVLTSLNGRVAGVNITTDGTPGGANTSTQIRGITTINNSSPLYVIDGIIDRKSVV